MEKLSSREMVVGLLDPNCVEIAKRVNSIQSILQTTKTGSEERDSRITEQLNGLNGVKPEIRDGVGMAIVSMLGERGSSEAVLNMRNTVIQRGMDNFWSLVKETLVLTPFLWFHDDGYQGKPETEIANVPFLTKSDYAFRAIGTTELANAVNMTEKYVTQGQVYKSSLIRKYLQNVELSYRSQLVAQNIGNCFVQQTLKWQDNTNIAFLMIYVSTSNAFSNADMLTIECNGVERQWVMSQSQKAATGTFMASRNAIYYTQTCDDSVANEYTFNFGTASSNAFDRELAFFSNGTDGTKYDVTIKCTTSNLQLTAYAIPAEHPECLKILQALFQGTVTREEAQRAMGKLMVSEIAQGNFVQGAGFLGVPSAYGG